MWALPAFQSPDTGGSTNRGVCVESRARRKGNNPRPV